jgi:hypothetical protein
MTKEVIRYVITVNNKSNLLDQILFTPKITRKNRHLTWPGKFHFPAHREVSQTKHFVH